MPGRRKTASTALDYDVGSVASMPDFSDNPYTDLHAANNHAGGAYDAFGGPPEDDQSLSRCSCRARPCWAVAIATVGFLMPFPLSVAAGLNIDAYVLNDRNSKGKFDCAITSKVPLGVGVACGCIGLLIIALAVGMLRVACAARVPVSGLGIGCRVILVVVLVLLGLVGTTASFVGALLRGIADSAPDLEPHLTLQGTGLTGGAWPTQDVVLTRDEYGLPTVSAQGVLDAAYGQGYLQAQDRLWQIEFQRLVAKGQLSSLVGKAALKIDEDMRRLNTEKWALEMCSHADATTKELLEAFVAGINAYVASTSTRPVEFSFMHTSWWPFARHEPAPFVWSDVCLAAKLLQLKLAGNMADEALRFRLWWQQGQPGAFGATYRDVLSLYKNQSDVTATVLTAEEMNITAAQQAAGRLRDEQDFELEEDLYESYFRPLRDSVQGSFSASASEVYAKAPATGKASARSRPQTDAADAEGSWGGFYDSDHPLLAGLSQLVEHRASNAWVARTPDGAPMGASDPHLQINLPSVWYQSTIQYPNGTVGGSPLQTVGVGMVGIPGVHIGQRGFVSWGITMCTTDLQDLFIAQPSQDQPETHYVVNGSVTMPYTIRREDITYRDGFFHRTKTLHIKETTYGPDVAPMLDLPDAVTASLQTVVLQSDRSSINGVGRLMAASDEITTGRKLCSDVFQQLRSPAFNIMVADAEGSLGYCISAAYKVRAQGHTGMWPTLGNGRYDSSAEDIPEAELPQLVLESKDIVTPRSISSANQKIYPTGYRYNLGFGYAPDFRGARIQSVLRNQSNLPELSNPSLHRRLQLDLRSGIWMDGILPRLLERRASLNSCASNTAWSLLESLLPPNFSGELPLGNTQGAVIWALIRALAVTPAPVVTPTLSKKRHWTEGAWVPTILDSRPSARDPQAIAFSDRLCVERLKEMGGTAANPGACDALPPCWQVFVREVEILADSTQPGGRGGPRWGIDIAQVEATNLMMSGSILKCMFDRTFDKPGDPSTVNVNDFNDWGDSKLTSHHASSMRYLYDWSKPQQLMFSFPAGTNGNPYSDYYDNLAKRWSNDEYVTIDGTHVSQWTP